MPHYRYFEDFSTGAVRSEGDYLVTRDEIVAFANQYDPQPFHTDADAAEASVYGGLTAPGTFILTVAIALATKSDAPAKVIALVGMDEVRFTHPVRPGDRLRCTIETVEVRASRSKADRGIVRNRFTVTNQNEAVVATFIDTILVARRAPASM